MRELRGDSRAEREEQEHILERSYSSSRELVEAIGAAEKLGEEEEESGNHGETWIQLLHLGTRSSRDSKVKITPL